MAQNRQDPFVTWAVSIIGSLLMLLGATSGLFDAILGIEGDSSSGGLYFGLWIVLIVAWLSLRSSTK